MCSAAINLTSRALSDVGNAEILLKIKGFIALFIQTMEVGLVSGHSTAKVGSSYCAGLGLLHRHPRFISTGAFRQVRRASQAAL